MSSNEPLVRRIEPPDVPAVVGLVHELALYERAAEDCTLTEAQLGTALFGAQPALFGAQPALFGAQPALFGAQPALFGHVAVVDGEVVGCALWFLNFSTWRGVHGIYLEDLYVQPAQRGRRLGRALLAELARECERRGYARLDWSVLDWNEPAIGFYEALGAQAEDDWRIFRLSDEPLLRLAQSK